MFKTILGSAQVNLGENTEINKGLSQIYQPVHKYKIGENAMKKIIDKTMQWQALAFRIRG